MKKIIALLLAAIMVIGVFAGCSTGKPAKNDSTKAPTTEATNSVVDATDSTSETADVDGTAATDSIDGTNGEDDQMSELENLLAAITTVKPMEFPTMTMDIDLSDLFAVKSYTGLDAIEALESAAFCEAMMGAQAYSVVLVKVKDAANADEVAQQMYDGIDTRKWVCVEADDLKVAVSGNMVLLVMMDSEYAADCTAQDVIDAFADKCGELTTTIGK